MKYMLLCLGLMVLPGLSQANSTLVQKRLKNMFEAASLPILAHDTFNRGLDEFKKKNDILPKEGVDWAALYDFCMHEKYIWSLVPMSTKKFDRMVNANHPRCRQFRVDNYPSFQQYLSHYPKDELHFDLRTELDVATREIFTKALYKTLWKAQERSYNIIVKYSVDKRLSAMEVCAAVALAQISEDFNRDVSRMYDYQTRLKFLALSVSDWYVRTKGNTKICPNFGLELRVDELTKRVERAEANIAKALVENAELRKEIQKINSRGNASAAAFLTLGFLGYRALTPR